MATMEDATTAMIRLDSRDDISLDAFRRVAWDGDCVCFSERALSRMRETRAAFLRLLSERPDVTVYGVTSGYGQRASQRLDATARRAHAAIPPYSSAVAFGEPLPARIGRGIVLARLANFVDGHSAISPELAQAVAALLQQATLPPVPALGNQSAGEIIALSCLLCETAERFTLGEKETLALINGSPCASALLADAALLMRHRLEIATETFALAAEALRAPPEHYDEALGLLWGDEFVARVLRRMRGYMAGGTAERRGYQAPVSFRIAPRLLARALRAQRRCEDLAERSLRAVTDNPIYLEPDARHPHGRVLSNGGFHNADAAPALDALTAACADLALLCDRQVSKLLDGHVSGLPDQLRNGGGYLGGLGFLASDCAERARACASATLLPGSEGGGFGQNDVGEPVFSAWEKLIRAGDLLDAALCALGVVSNQAFYVTRREPPPGLAALQAMVADCCAPVGGPRRLGPDVERLRRALQTRIYPNRDDTIAPATGC